jgi:hypothetical protein
MGVYAGNLNGDRLIGRKHGSEKEEEGGCKEGRR